MQRSVPQLVRVACLLALLALALVCWSVLDPRPIPVILAMSVGHVVGGAAFACYLLAVVLDAVRRPPSAEDPILTTAQALDARTKHKGSLASSSRTKA